MYWKLVKEDIKNSLGSSLIIGAFILIAAALASLSLIMLVDLGAAVNQFLEKSQTPHLIQMHSGDIDYQALASFAQGEDLVQDYQVIEMTNIEGADIILGQSSLADNIQDNGFQVQSSSFDFLLDLDNEIVQAQPGQVYLPLAYRDLTRPGDQASIGGHSLEVAGFLRDSQMNSNLSSSKRFLVHEDDYQKIKKEGQVEYIIEFLVHDTSRIGDLEASYMEAGLASNGPTISYQLVRLINSLSDGLVIALLALIFFLLSS